MLKRLTRRLARRYRRAETVVVRWNTARPLRRRLSRSTDQALDRALRAASLDRSDLFTAFKGNARHRKRLAAMMLRVQIDRRQAAAAFWPQLREADSRCADCPRARRCMRTSQRAQGLLIWPVATPFFLSARRNMPGRR